MRIVIDMQGAQTESRFRGIGRYTLAFAQAVVRNRGEHEVLLALNGLFADTIEPIRAAFDGLLPQENICVWGAPGPVKEREEGNGVRRETAELIREAFLASLQPDIIHISSLFEGYVDDAVTSIGRFDRKVAVSVTLHDLIPLINPDRYLKPNPRYEHYYLRKIESLNKASLYLSVSESSKEEGKQFLSAPDEYFVNTLEAVESNFCPQFVPSETAYKICAKLHINRPFVLYTGGADERKNLPRLIQAWVRLPASLRQSHQLLFAGGMWEGHVNELRQIAKEQGLEPDELIFSGYVTDTELVQLYNLCKIFVLPSWHEGFGLPALEAMACGAPVIGANISSLPEVIGFHEALFDPFDVADIAQKMARALADENFCTRLKSHGLQQAKKFSWDETAKRAIRSWEDLAKTPEQPTPIRIPGRSKPRLAFVSPLPPERTGIADYSAELLPVLAAHYDIELVVAQEQVDEHLVKQFGTPRDVAWLRTHAAEIDRVIYQIGNSPFHRHMLSLLKEVPGVVVLHDFYLSALMYWLEFHGGESHAWTCALYESHGYSAVRDHFRTVGTKKWDFCVNHYPANISILQHAQGVIVHSEQSRTLARKWYGSNTAAEWQVIPHLRSPADVLDKRLARQKLGIDENDFVVCSFGFLGPSKLNHRLLNAWLNSALAADKRCCLVFVGENHGGSYGSSLIKMIIDSGLGDRIRITGFASPELFKCYLSASDLSVQLRTQSRGESSGTVLDAMNYGLPVIVNANGSFAEIPTEAAYMLPDDFTDSELIGAIEELWRAPEHRHAIGKSAMEVINLHHTPKACAFQYALAIESFHKNSSIPLPTVLSAIAAQDTFFPCESELVDLSYSLAATFPMPQPRKRLFLDVTATFRHDLKTGIERFVRAVTLSLLEHPPNGYRVEPVYLTDEGGTWHHNLAHDYTLRLLGCPIGTLTDKSVTLQAGDILLTLDLSAINLLQAEQAGVFRTYRNLGVSIYTTVFDLLPVLQPRYFPQGADQDHQRWLESIFQFDGAVCISKAVADDLRSWQKSNEVKGENRRPFSIGWFHLGADISNSAPSSGLGVNTETILQQIYACPTFIMVGTIEPRKGYLQTIEAFNQLWQRGVNVNLVIVGHEGWKGLPVDMRRDISVTIERLLTHAELNKRMFWLEGISDEYLEKLYAASTCLIAASYGEGFGLPLIEAAQHKLPIIARDIPVFREVAGEHAYYFEGNSGNKLAAKIQSWLTLYHKGRHPKSEKMSWNTWEKSAQQLLKFLCII
jgi:glycosyltransferase involved in cell wall biosynthesis